MTDVVKTIGTDTTGAGTGTVSCSATTAVTGSGTSFTTELTAPGVIEISGTLYDIASITDNTNLTLTANGPSVSSVAFNIGTRDYSTVSAWEADIDDTGLYPSSTYYPVGQICSDSLFDEDVVINGGNGTTGVAKVTLQSHPDHRHDGTEGTGAGWSISGTSSNAIQVSTANYCATYIEWIEWDGNDYASGTQAILTTSSNTFVRNNIIHHHNGSHFDTDATIRPSGSYAPVYVQNNILYKNLDYNIYTYVGNGPEIRIQNNTCWAGEGGVRGIARTNKFYQNNISIGATVYNDFDAISGSSVVADHNLSSDATAVDYPSGSTSIINETTAIFVSTSPVDLRLASGAAAIGAGTDLSSVGAGIEIDIEGNDRTGLTWDIGAHQYQSAGGVSLAPPSSALTFTGNVPGVSTGVNVSVPLESITFTSYAPAAGSSVEVAPPSHAATFAGFAPAVATGANVAPPAGTLAFTGLAPAIGSGAAVGSPSNAIIFTGYAPTVGSSVNVAAPVETIAFTGNAPAVATGANVAPPSETLTFTGLAPTIGGNINVSPPSGALTFTGFAPTVETGVNVTPPVGATAFTGHIPSIALGVNVTPPSDTIVFSSFAPAPSQSVNVQSPVEAVTFTGLAPSVTSGANVASPVDSIVFSSFAPAVATGANVKPPAGTMTFTGYAPSPGVPVVVAPPVDALTFAGFAPSIATGVNVQVPAGALSFNSFVPDIATGVQLDMPAGSLSFTGYAPTVAEISVPTSTGGPAIVRISRYMRPIRGVCV